MKRKDKFRKRPVHKRRHIMPRAGSIAGSLIADAEWSKPKLHLISYDGDKFVEEDVETVEEISDYKNRSGVLWLDVDGLGDIDIVGQIGKIFGIHQLALEDILFSEHRPKVDQFGESLFVVLRTVEVSPKFEADQLSVIMLKNCVLTFHQTVAPKCLEPVRQRLRDRLGLIRDAGSDFLLYTIIDCVIDEFFPILEQYGEQLEDLEDEIIDDPTRDSVARMHNMKRDLLSMRRVMWPTREVVNSILRDSESLLAQETATHMRDCYDHTVQVIDFIETYRELAADLMDVYLSSLSNKMNEVMRVLTIITTVFVPPTFIAGIYGMNFKPEVSKYNMPELTWKYGYEYALSLMAGLAILTIGMLWWRGWLGALIPKGHRDQAPPPQPDNPAN